jgi:hypothetical protein
MRDSSSVLVAAILAFTVVVSSGCGGSGIGAPSGASAPLAARRFVPAEAFDVSGGYAGTVKDRVYGSGKIDGDLAQHQSGVGGFLTFLNVSPPFGMTTSFLLKGRSLTGNGILGNTVGDLCPTSVTATYTSSHTLNGSYKVNSGSCSHSAGTFTMKQTCTYGEGLAMDLSAMLKRC